MKKIISVATACAMLLTTNFIYADNEEKQVDKKLEVNRAEQASLHERIKSLDSKVLEIEKEIEESNSKIETLNVEIEKNQEEIKKLQENINKNEELLGQRLKVINDNYSMGYIKVILSSTSLSDFFNNIFIVQEVVEQDKKILKELDENKIEIEDKEQSLNDKKAEQEDLQEILEQNNETVQADKSELEALKRELESEEEDLQNELERIAAENAAQNAEQNQSNADDSLSGQVISSGSWPVPGYSRISSPYGYRTHPVLNTQKMHTGIDIPAPTGTPVVSVDGGRVIYSGVQGSYGNTVMVDHGNGKVSLYAHNSQLLVSVGQTVQKGQAIAKIGSTGMSTGPHLHFEIRINGKHTNPVPYI